MKLLVFFIIVLPTLVGCVNNKAIERYLGYQYTLNELYCAKDILSYLPNEKDLKEASFSFFWPKDGGGSSFFNCFRIYDSILLEQLHLKYEGQPILQRYCFNLPAHPEDIMIQRGKILPLNINELIPIPNIQRQLLYSSLDTTYSKLTINQQQEVIKDLEIYIVAVEKEIFGVYRTKKFVEKI